MDKLDPHKVVAACFQHKSKDFTRDSIDQLEWKVAEIKHDLQHESSALERSMLLFELERLNVTIPYLRAILESL